MLPLGNLSNWGQNAFNEEVALRREEEERRRSTIQPLRIQIPPNYSSQNLANFYLQEDIECMAQYRNESGNLTMPDEFKEISDSDVYFYLGHGSTLLDNGRPIIRTVPDDCIYITQTVCGIVNMFDEKLIKAFMNSKNEKIWKDPITYIQDLRKILKDVPGIHIHMPGCTYTDTSFLPFSSNGDAGNRSHFLQYSGLLSLADAKTIPEESDYVKGMHEDLRDGTVDASVIEELYRYSSFPKTKEKKIRSYVPRGVSLESISLVKNANGKVLIADIVNQNNNLSDNYPVSRILEMKPGIHFNFLCRSIKITEQKRNVTLRRKHSALLQNTIANTISKLAGMGFASKNAKEELSNDKSVLSFIKAVSEEIEERKEIQAVYTAYRDLEYYGYSESKEYLREIFEEIYKEEFFALLAKVAEATDPDTIDKLKKQRESLVKVLDLRIPDLDNNPKRFSMEIELMVIMALTALTVKDFEFYRFLCKRGVDVGRLYTLLKEHVKDGILTREELEAIDPYLDECHRERTEYVYPNSNNNNDRLRNTSNNNNESVRSYANNGSSNRNSPHSESGKGGRRKTLRKKRKSSAA